MQAKALKSETATVSACGESRITRASFKRLKLETILLSKWQWIISRPSKLVLEIKGGLESAETLLLQYLVDRILLHIGIPIKHLANMNVQAENMSGGLSAGLLVWRYSTGSNQR
jgi:hypothetical protein